MFCLDCVKGPCFGPVFDDDGAEGGADEQAEDEEEDDDTVDGNVAYASCDLVGAFAKVGQRA